MTDPLNGLEGQNIIVEAGTQIASAQFAVVTSANIAIAPNYRAPVGERMARMIAHQAVASEAPGSPPSAQIVFAHQPKSAIQPEPIGSDQERRISFEIGQDSAIDESTDAAPACSADAQDAIAASHASMPDAAESSAVPRSRSPDGLSNDRRSSSESSDIHSALNSASLIHSDTNAPQLPGPVFDPVSGKINRANLRLLCDGFVANLSLMAHSQGPSIALLERLRASLARIGMSVAENSALSARDLAWLIRDGFEAASIQARGLSNALESADIELRAIFRILSALFVELKRTHLTAGAAVILGAYARGEVEGLERAAPGLNRGMTGAIHQTGWGIDATGIVGGVGRVGGGFSQSRNFSTDEDTKTNFGDSVGGIIQAGVSAKFPGKLGGKVTISMLHEAGNYVKSRNLLEAVILDANRQANNSWTYRSASPKARQLMHGWRRLKNTITAYALGKHHVQGADIPLYLSDRKLIKGAFNMPKIALFAEAVDALHGEGRRWQELLGAAYPAVNLQLEMYRAQSGPLPLSPLRNALPLADQVTVARKGKRHADIYASKRTQIEVAGNLTLTSDDAALGGAASLNANHARVTIERLKSAHQLLDTAYTKDLRQTFRVHRELEQVLGKGPRLHLYNSVLNRQYWSGRILPELPDAERTYYGVEAEIGVLFLETIVQPSFDKLDALQAACDSLADTYIVLIDAATKMMSRSDRFTDAALVQPIAELPGAAFDEINRVIWSGAYRSRREALADPQKFIAQSFDAVSLALGNLGTHLSILNRQLALRGYLNDAESQTRIQAVNHTYQITRNLLEALNLPVKEDTVMRYGTLCSQSITQKYGASFKLSLNGGALFNLVRAFATQAKKSINAFSAENEVDHSDNEISLVNEAGQMALSVQVQYQQVKKHNNSAKRGEFIELRMGTVAGAPIAEKVITIAVNKALEKIYPGTKCVHGGIDDFDDVVREITGLVQDINGGGVLVISLRRFPGAAKSAYLVQYVRLLNEKNSGLNLAVPFAGPGGAAIVKWKTAEIVRSPAIEILGSDLGYHVLQSTSLINLLKKEGEDSQSDLKALFDAAPHLKNKYFGSYMSIAGIVKNYAVFLDADGMPDRSDVIRNEFFRYIRKNKFRELSERSKEVDHYAAGASAGNSLRRIWEAPPVPLSASLILPAVDWTSLETELAAMENADQRLEYFAAEGRPIFDAYVHIVDAYRQLNDIAKANHGYRIALRDEG